MDAEANDSRMDYSNATLNYQKKSSSAKVLESLCHAFRNNKCSLNSPLFTLDQTEVSKVLNSIKFYKSTLEESESIDWHIECGENSTSSLESSEAAREKLVCHIRSKSKTILAKIVIKQPEKRFFRSKLLTERNSSLQLLHNMQQFSWATIKDRYKVPHNFSTLRNIQNNGLKFNIFGVVTAVNKLPTKTRLFWHSFVCISDPTLVSDTDSPPDEFKMHLFFPFLQDHPEIHSGDVIRFTNVKIESHQNRCDGRIFSKEDLKVFCHPDYSLSVPKENNVEHSTIIRILSKWWKLNVQYFDCLTPRPIHRHHYKYPGVRLLQDVSDELVCDIYCQVVGQSDDGEDFSFMYVRDGTIFTLEKPQLRQEEGPVNKEKESINYGYLALLVFDSQHWKHIKAMNICVNDFIFVREAKVLVVATDAFDAVGGSYPFRYPCIMLRFHSGGGVMTEKLRKIPADHHEAVKIRSRLHRLPLVLEEMKSWRLPPVVHEDTDDLCARLSDPSVQTGLLKRIKRI